MQLKVFFENEWHCNKVHSKQAKTAMQIIWLFSFSSFFYFYFIWYWKFPTSQLDSLVRKLVGKFPKYTHIQSHPRQKYLVLICLKSFQYVFNISLRYTDFSGIYGCSCPIFRNQVDRLESNSWHLLSITILKPIKLQ